MEDQQKDKKEIQQILNKLTSDNFDILSEDLLNFAKNHQLVDQIIDMLIQKAWNEPRYTKTYVQVVVKLTKQKFDWDKDKKKHTIRNKVLVKVEKTYDEGFQDYYNYIQKINKEVTNAQEKFDMKQVKKQQLLGNINFICELFEQKILSFFIFKMIILFGLYNFIKEYIRAQRDQDENNIIEDYLEAQLKIFFNVGEFIEKKEKKEFEQFQQEDPDFEEDTETMEDALEDMKFMIQRLQDKTQKYMEKENLTKLSKAKFRISQLFFNFMRYIKTLEIGIRMESMIENLEEYKKSNYTQKIQKVKAAKKLAEVQKDIQAQKDQNQEEFENYKY